MRKRALCRARSFSAFRGLSHARSQCLSLPVAVAEHVWSARQCASAPMSMALGPSTAHVCAPHCRALHTCSATATCASAPMSMALGPPTATAMVHNGTLHRARHLLGWHPHSRWHWYCRTHAGSAACAARLVAATHLPGKHWKQIGTSQGDSHQRRQARGCRAGQRQSCRSLPPRRDPPHSKGPPLRATAARRRRCDDASRMIVFREQFFRKPTSQGKVW